MKKFNRYILSSILCTCLTACNSGGSSNNIATNSTEESKELNWRFSWSSPIASLFQKGLGWYVTIQNDSDYTYVVQAISGSSRINGEDTWEEDTELDRSTTIPPHTVKVIYGESYKSGPKSFNLSTSDGTIRNQVITLHKDRENQSDDFYITNDTYQMRGEAVFNHGAKNSLKTAATIAVILGDILLIAGGEVAAEKISQRVTSRALIKDLATQTSQIEELITKEKIAVRAPIQSQLDKVSNDLSRLQNSLKPSLQSEEITLEQVLGKSNINTKIKQLTQLQRELSSTLAQQERMLNNNAEINAFNAYAGYCNQRFDLNLSDAEIKQLGEYLRKLYNANMNTNRLHLEIQNFNNQIATQRANPASNLQITRSSLQDFKIKSELARNSINDIVKSGYIVPTSTKILGAAVGGLFGAGATYGVINSFDAAGKDAVLTSIQIDNSGIGNVGSFNNAPVDEYLVSCDNLGGESDTTIAMCKDNNNKPQISTLNLKLNLREKENIVNNNGYIQGSDQYHKYCSYSYNDNGVIYALCDSDDKLLKLDYSHDCAKNAEIKYDNGNLVCSKYRYQYLNSCTSVDVPTPVQGMITAQCKDEKGILHDGFTVLDSTLCASGSDIINRNANLICAKYKSNIPHGSYLDNCTIGYYESRIGTADYGVIGANCSDKNGIMEFQQLNYLKECAPNSTISISPNGYLRCDQYEHYLTATDVANLRIAGKDAELKRLFDLGKIQ